MRREFGDSLEHVTEIGITVAATDRRADGEEHDVGALHALAQRTQEMHTAGCDIARHQLVAAILVLVDADDVPAKIGKTGGGNQADITRTNHAKSSRRPPHPASHCSL